MSSPSRSGVFAADVDRRVADFTESISVDRRLYQHDLAASHAHAQMLAAVGLLTPGELVQIEDALKAIGDRFQRGEIELGPRLEDVHMHIEQALIDQLGDVGRKLHTGRSRNDQVATDLRLWCREAVDRLTEGIHNLQRAFVARCDADQGVIVPAYTHLQRAQPVLVSHYWLAYCERFERDVERLADCRRRTNWSPLGAAAIAGSSLPIDREQVARALDFDGVMANSMDASSDRDFVLELAFCLSLIALHLSGWAEEWILWSSTEFDFLELPEAYCTGSSIMPHKVNPDVLELIRGRAARAVGGLQGLLLLTKGLPLGYHRDLQEDKVHLFAAADSVQASLQMAEPLVRQSRVRGKEIASRLAAGFLDATTLMEHLILRGVPQRSAHHQVGTLVQEATRRGCTLAELPIDVLQSVSPQLDASAISVLGAEQAVLAFRSYGSTAPVEVEAQITRWKERLCADS